jgi:fatty-acyl-CoA synthase
MGRKTFLLIGERKMLKEAVVYSCYSEFDRTHEVRWTYQEYRERANQVACGLMALGLNKGDHIAVWATQPTGMGITGDGSCQSGPGAGDGQSRLPGA